MVTLALQLSYIFVRTPGPLIQANAMEARAFSTVSTSAIVPRSPSAFLPVVAAKHSDVDKVWTVPNGFVR